MGCDEIDDLLPGYVLGVLDHGEKQSVEQHLASCSQHPQVAGYRRVAGVLADTLTPVSPPEQVKHKLMARVYQDLQPGVARQPWYRAQWSWLVAAVLAVVALGLGVRDYLVSSELAAAPLLWQLQPAVAGVQTSGALVYLPKEHTATLTLHQLPPLPASDVYEVWLLKGGAAQPAGVFRPQTDGSASVLVNGQPSSFDALAVTQEPGPNGSPAPTRKPFVSASLK